MENEYFMKEALKLAQKAASEDEVPVGALVVYNNKIIGKGHNQTEILKDVTAHAEMIAITAAANYSGSKFLDECVLYVTLEPCAMCGAAINWARFHKIVYGAAEPKFGFSRFTPSIIGKKTEIISGLLAAESEILLKNFFKQKR